MTTTTYSQRLGPIAAAQFAAAVSRLGLGEFVSATPISTGLFGQNVFVTTTAGEFVLRGAPHWVRGANDATSRQEDRFQFTKEACFARALHEHTHAPAPWPYLHDETSDIFGWPYVVMPRMPGCCFDERSILTALGPDERREVAAALGATLAEMQRLTSPFAGDFDPDTIALAPDPGGYGAHVAALVTRLAAEAEAGGFIGAEDVDWTRSIVGDAPADGGGLSTFTHGDYKLANMTVAHEGGRWLVAGVFDLHTARFGDGAFDLAHQTCCYLETERDMARVFVEAYLADAPAAEGLARRMPLYIAANRLGIWSGFSRADRADDERPEWSRGKTFRGWAKRYVARIVALV